MIWTHWLAIGAIMGGVGVGAGAFGAHALKTRLTPEDLAIYDTAIRYWMIHTLAICTWALVQLRIESTPIKVASFGMVLGSLIFSGSLIALVLTGNRILGAVTPIGGVILIASWFLVAWGAITHGNI